ncbi:MAG: YggU family protein, partial [Spirochaetes bacterium RIFOXYB1_FULL_32_8]
MITDKDSSILFDLKVVPRSSLNKLEIKDEEIRLKIKAPPVDGEANKMVIEFFADYLSVPKRDITIEKGRNSKNKLIKIQGFNKNRLLEIIGTK